MSLGLSLGAVPFGLSLDIGGAAHVGPDFSHIPELEPIEPALSDDTSTALKSPKGVFEFVEETIASGSRGSILKGTWQKDGGEPQPCVVKVMPLGKLKEGDGLLEGTGHDSVSRSEHVVTLYDFGRTDEHVYMVMEPCDTSLKDACYEPYQSSHDARKAMASALLQALKDVHDTGHLHGDIKPANILLKDGKVLLADFGGFKASPSSQLQGTHHYLAPDSPQTDRTDIYMLGVTLAEVGFGLKFTEVTHSIHTAMKFSQVMTTEMDKVIKRVAPHETYEAFEASLAEAPLSEENSESAVKHCIDTLLAYKDTVPFTAQKEGLAFVARMLEPSSTRPSSTALLSEAYLNS
jgi:serine/threonine protein kinase